MILQTLFAIATVSATSLVLKSPKRLVIHIGLIGGCGWLTYLLCVQPFGPLAATYLSSVLIAVLSHVCARIYKTPVTVFFIPSYYTLVPGATMYKSVYSYINGQHQAGGNYLLEAILISGMIALAIFSVDSLFKIFSYRYSKKGL